MLSPAQKIVASNSSIKLVSFVVVIAIQALQKLSATSSFSRSVKQVTEQRMR